MSGLKRVAVVTASYADDFERCRLLCDSMDALVENATDHFILVDKDDFQLFSQLDGARRHVVNELDILPRWLHSMRQGLSQSARKVWFSTKTWPLRGWHVQQLRRIALAGHIDHEALLYCDSDVLFVKPFSTDFLWKGDDLRLYRKPEAIGSAMPDAGVEHMAWTRSAAALNGLSAPSFPAHDYIQTLISWKRQHVLDMCSHIEAVTGKHWVAAMGGNRSFSECQIYGAYADGVCGARGHWHSDQSFCQTYWSGDALTADTAGRFVETMGPGQVAIGIQSFTGTDPAVLRHLLTA